MANHEKYFDTAHLAKDLKTRSLKGGSATMLGQGLKFVLTTASTIVLARMLAPADFGLVAMVIALTQFALQFRDLGLSTATIQRDHINHGQVSTLFWINTGVGVLFTILTIAAAPLIAAFYKDPRLTSVAIALSPMFLLSGLSVQHQALLRRQMRFGVLAIFDVLSIAFGFIVAVSVAWADKGYWALVAARVSTPLAFLVGVWIACSWRPSSPVRGSGVRSMLSFGGNITAFNTLNYFSRNLDSVLIGRTLGAAILGLYDKAYSLLVMPITNIRAPVNAVAVPTLARLQGEPERYRRYYCKIVALIGFLSMPLMALCFASADALVIALLGKDWAGAADFIRILAFVGFLQPVVSTNGAVYVSCGRADRMLRWGMWNSSVTVACFFVGLHWGAKGVAYGYVVATYIMLWPTLWHAFATTSVRIRDFLEAIWRPAIASLITGAVIILLRPRFSHSTELAQFVACCGLAASAYLLAWLLIPGGRVHLRELISYARMVLARSPSPNATETKPA